MHAALCCKGRLSRISMLSPFELVFEHSEGGAV